jgi:TATA-binding protein-associated factor Taf7
MARGWESKSVEEQIESSKAKEVPSGEAARAKAQLQLGRERGVLELSRKKVQKDLETATNPRYRKTLEAALEHLNKKLTELK